MKMREKHLNYHILVIILREYALRCEKKYYSVFAK